MAGKFFYRDAYIIKIIKFNDQIQILTLISKEEGKFSAIWSTPDSKKIGMDCHPVLFSFIHAVIQRKSEANFTIRKFETISYIINNYHSDISYNLCCFSSRLTQLIDEDLSSEHSAFPIWENLNITKFEKIDYLNILCDFLFIHGLWFSFSECEKCHSNYNNYFYLEDKILICYKCKRNHSKRIDLQFIDFMRAKYSSDVKNKYNSLKSMQSLLPILIEFLNRLDPKLLCDKIIKKVFLRIQ